MPTRRPAGMDPRASGMNLQHRRLTAGLLLSLLLHGMLLRWALTPGIAPKPASPAGDAEPPRIQIAWVETPALKTARQPASVASAPMPMPERAPVRRRERPTTAPEPRQSLPAASAAIPAETNNPASPAGLAEANDSYRSAKALGRLLDSAPGREAVQSAARQEADRPRLQIQREDALASAMRGAAHGDCMKGEFKGGGMGLLSLPMLAAAALQGECSR